MIIANMATFPARAPTLRDAVIRISSQVDQLNLCLNEYQAIPDWVNDFPNLNAVIPNQDLKDLGKFMFEVHPQDDVFLVDDDIHYPDDYVSSSISRRDLTISLLKSPGVVGYHGTIYHRWGLVHFFKNALRLRSFQYPQTGKARTVHSYYFELKRPRIVAQLGTGTVLVKGHQMPSLDFMMGSDRRADVRFARWCFEQKFPQVAMPRPANWMPSSENDEHAIYNTYTSHLPKEFVDEISSFVFDVPKLGGYLKNA